MTERSFEALYNAGWWTPELSAMIKSPEVRAAVARQSEPEEKNIRVNLTIDDMEWEAEMVFGYDGWDDDEGTE